ncbi:MAG: sensor histidine kinase [Elainellaceae cyanobacterium]
MLSPPELIQGPPSDRWRDQSLQSALTPNSSLSELFCYDSTLSTSRLTKEAVEAFESDPLLPGILLIDQGKFAGMLSRQRFLEQMSRPYSLELFPERPLALLYELLDADNLILSQDTGIVDAVGIALKRSTNYRYEPIVVDRDGRFALLDFHHLLMAQSWIHQLTAELLDQRTQDYLVQTEKMASLGRMVAGISHEIKNPVNCIHGNLDFVSQYGVGLLELLDLYREALESGPAAVDTTKIDQAEAELDLDFLRQDLPALIGSMSFASERLFDIVSSLRNFSRFDREDKQRIDIHRILDGTLIILNSRINERISVIKQYGDLPDVLCYPGQIGQVFMNIMSNAVEALDERMAAALDDASGWQPQLALTTEVIYADTARILVRITDSGGGISPDVQQQIFKEFFTTKSIDEGTGLGLAISHQIVKRHHGSIDLRSQVGVGTEFDITLPVSADS